MRCWSAARDAGAPAGQYQWTLYTSFSSQSWSGPLAAGIDGTVDLLAPPQGASLAQTEAKVLVEVDGVASLTDYANVQRMLEAVPGVRGANIVRAAGNAVDVRYNSARRLRRARSRAVGHRRVSRDSAGALRLRARRSINTTRRRRTTAPVPRFRRAPSAEPDLPPAPRADLAGGRGVGGGQLSPWRSALFVVAAVSDGLDGYLAKRFNWTSELGKFLDPMADKLLLMTVFVESAWLGLVPWWITAAAVARDVMIGLGALVFRVWFGPLRGRPDGHQQDQHRRAASVSGRGDVQRCGRLSAARGAGCASR